jgi:hypothetical protein
VYQRDNPVPFLLRPADYDRDDIARLTQTHLEQIQTNAAHVSVNLLPGPIREDFACPLINCTLRAYTLRGF